jgi:hypothetical protein
MGMFDSFRVENGEVQTKQLGCLLNFYELGDTVESLSGLESYVLIEDDYPSNDWYGFVIVNNIYVEYIKLENSDDAAGDDLLATYLKHPKFLTYRLLELLKIKNVENFKLCRKLQKCSSMVRKYMAVKDGIPEELKFLYTDFDDGETLEGNLFKILDMVEYE